MRRLWCAIFGHKLKRPRKSKGESGLYTTCIRCDKFFIRDYFSGWMPASANEQAHYLKMYGPKTDEPAADLPESSDPKDAIIEGEEAIGPRSAEAHG